MEQERNQLNIKQSNGLFSPAAMKHMNPPKQSDAKGTAFRIRPQTPKLNLLDIKAKKRVHHLEALPASIKSKAT